LQASKALKELRAYRQANSSQKLKAVVTTLEQSRQSYKQAQADLVLLTSQRQGLGNLSNLLNLSNQDWSQTQMAMHRVAEHMLTQGIPLGLPPELIRRAVEVQIKGSVVTAAEGTAISLLTTTLQPNLIQDSDRTRLQADRAAEAVKPVMVEVSEGDLIVAAGHSISQSQFVLLDHFNLSQRRFNYGGLGLFGSLIAGCLVIFLWIERLSHHHLDRRDYLLVTLMVIASGCLNMFGAVAYGLPAIGMLAGSFYGPPLGCALMLMLALVLPIGSSVSGVAFAAGIIGAVVSSLLAERMRSREELAMLGVGVGLTQASLYLILSLIINPVALGSAWLIILTSSGLQGVCGILSTIAALGLSPYLERGFDLITPIRLAELSNPNRPILKRLASEAPGTFQHTLFVATLAEAAARALGCNVELVRAGTLYHDIGKMHDPLAFIENQMGGPNKHETLQNPWLSAAIIKKHVTEGLAMARKCRLPRAVQAFIPEHQGTMLISYFYHQAAELAKTNSSITLEAEEFRYPGPTPNLQKPVLSCWPTPARPPCDPSRMPPPKKL
jgi:putative nucleotidyltransferase with HDIG domain